MYAYMTVVLPEFYIIVAQNTWYASSVRKQNHKREEKNTQTFDFTIGAGQCVAGKQVSTTEDTLHISVLYYGRTDM